MKNDDVIVWGGVKDIGKNNTKEAMKYVIKRSDCRILPAKMAASATTTGSRHISVIFRHGNVARPGGCCVGRVTSHARGLGGRVRREEGCGMRGGKRR